MATLQRVVVAMLLAGCMRLDGFVYRARQAKAGESEKFSSTIIPADLQDAVSGPIVSDDGVVIDAALVRHRAGDGTPDARHTTALLYCHGNNTFLGVTTPRIEELWRLGYTVLLLDYRGFGRTSGTPTEEGVYKDARAARAWLESRVDLGLSPARVGLYGRSLGTAICLHIAAERAPKALILESPIAAISTIIDDSLGLDAPAEWFVDTKMDNPNTAGALTGPLFILHGLADTYVQPKYGQSIHDAAVHASPNLLWLVPGATHGTVPCNPGANENPAIENDCSSGFSAEYEKRVTEFYDAAIGP